MKRLNLKFLLFLLIPAIVLPIGIHFIHSDRVTATEAMWREQADVAKKEGRKRDALKQLAKYLRKHPGVPELEQEAAHLAADIFLEEDVMTREDFARAQGQLQKAARSATKPEDKRAMEHRLIEVLVKVRYFSDADDLIKQHLKQTPNDPELTFLAAQCAEALQLEGDKESPEYHYSRLIGFLPDASAPPFFDDDSALDKSNIEAYWLLANFYRGERQDPARGDSVIDGMLKSFEEFDAGDLEARKKASQAWYYRGKYRGLYQATSGIAKEMEEHKADARREIEKAVEINPDNEIALLTVGVLEFEAGRIEEAKKILLKVLERHPDSLYAYIRMAQLSHMEGDIKKAASYVDLGLDHNPGNNELLWYKVVYLLELRDGEGLREAIDEMVTQKFPRTMVMVAKAVLPICEKDWSKSARLLENVEPHVANFGRQRELVLKSLALCYRMTQEFDRELGVYKRLADDPVIGGTDDVLLRMVRSLMDQDRMNDAYELLLPRIQRAKNVDDVPIEIRILGKEIQQWRRRNKLDDRFVAQKPTEAPKPTEKVEGRPEDWLQESSYWRKVYLKTQEFFAADKDEEAFKFMAESLEIQDRHIVEMPEGTDDEKAAKEQALAVWSNFYYFYVGKILERKGLDDGVPAALEALTKLQKKNGDNPRVVIESARILSSTPSKGTHELLRKLEERIGQFSTEQQTPAWIQMASAYLRMGRAGFEDVERCWRHALTLSPSHKPTLQQSFQFAMQTDDQNGMSEILDKMKEAVSEDDALWKYARAYSLVRSIEDGTRMRSNLEEAVRLVDEAMDIRRDWAVLYELRGQINEALGDVDAARGDYDNARRRGSNNPRVIARLVELQLKAGKVNEAQAVLSAVGPLFPGLERFRAYLKIARGGGLDDTMRTIDAYVTDDSTDWKLFIEKGEMCRQAALRFKDEAQVKELHAKAESAFRAAVNVGRYRPETWLSLVNFLIGTKRNVLDAEAVLRDAEAELPDDVARPVMAQGYVNLRDFVQAEHYLMAIADAEPDNLSIKKAMAEYYLRTKQNDGAVSQLEKMIAAQDSADKENIGHVMWARRQMAAALLQSGTHADFRSALDQVQANLSIMPRSLQDAILKAQLLANRPEPRYQREAMKLLERIYETDPKFLNFESTLLLARLYYRDAGMPPEERWARASRLMDLLLDDSPLDLDQQPRSPAQKATLLAQFASMLLDRGDAAQASGHIRNLAVLQPNYPRTIRLLAIWNLANKKRQAAEQAIETLVPKETITNTNAPMLLRAAQLFDEQKLDDRAEALFRRLAKEHPTGKLRLAEYLASRGQSKEAGAAIAIAREVVQGKTAYDYLTACNIGLSAIRRLGNNATDRQRDEVAGWFREGRTVDGSRVQLLRIRLLEADFAIVTDNHQLAAKIYRDMLDRDDLNDNEEGQIANNLAYLLAARGQDLEEAEQYANRAQELFGPNPSVLDTKGVVHLMKGECEKSRRSLEEATSMNAGVPGFSSFVRGDVETRAQMYFHLALAYKCVGDKPLATEAWEMALAGGFRASDAKPIKREMHDELQVWINSQD